MTYRQQVQLWLNMDRAMTRAATAVARGVRAARSPAGVEMLLAELADAPEAGRAMRRRAAADAETARLKAAWLAGRR